MVPEEALEVRGAGEARRDPVEQWVIADAGRRPEPVDGGSVERSDEFVLRGSCTPEFSDCRTEVLTADLQAAARCVANDATRGPEFRAVGRPDQKVSQQHAGGKHAICGRKEPASASGGCVAVGSSDP